MRTSFFLASLALAALPPLACSSSQPSAPAPDAGADALADGGGTPIPKTEACTGATSACLHGTATAKGFTATPNRMQVSLYDAFPSGAATPVKTLPVALDGTWAFSDVTGPKGEASWSHFYVQVAADFGQMTADGGAAVAPARVVGPFTLPSTAALPALEVLPVQLALLESAASGAFQVDWVQALVFDPATGAPLTGSAASVSITMGGAATPVPWGTSPAGQPAYFLQFATPPAAQQSYTVTTTPMGGGAASMWTLAATTPGFTPSITAPAAGATVPKNMDLSVSWPAQPLADYEIVEVFESIGSKWVIQYNSASPVAPDTTSEAVPASALMNAGSYLVDVSFANAGCPASASGCVLASTAATAQISAN